MTREELLKIAKPILFNTEMVRAIMDGRKTVTRRICKVSNEFSVPDMSFYNSKKRTYAVHNYMDKEHTEKLCTIEKSLQICPLDIRYVRQTWSDHYVPDEEGKPKLEYCYKADGIDIKAECLPGENNRWYPSIHMPKDAARIFIKVTDVRVERLWEITDEQAKAEGIREYSKDGMLYKYAVTVDWWIDYHNKHRKSFNGNWWQDMPRTERKAFSYFWNSTIKKSDLDTYGWDANPWVWVIEFERIIPD